MAIVWDKIYTEEKNNWSRATNNWLAQIIKNYQIKGTALDIGCGTGEVCNMLRQLQIKPLGIDLSGVAINAAKKKYPDGNFLNFNIETEIKKLPKFNLILDIKVLPFIGNKTKYVEKIRKLMRPEGFYISKFPIKHPKSIFLTKEYAMDLFREFTWRQVTFTRVNQKIKTITFILQK